MNTKKQIQLILEDGCKLIECDGVYSIIDEAEEKKSPLKIRDYLRSRARPTR